MFECIFATAKFVLKRRGYMVGRRTPCGSSKRDVKGCVGMNDTFIHHPGKYLRALYCLTRRAHFHCPSTGASVRATSTVATALEATNAIWSHRTCMDNNALVPKQDYHWAMFMKA